MIVRQLDWWKLIMGVNPRAGVNTVDNIVSALQLKQGMRPKRFKRRCWRNYRIPPGYLGVKFVRNPYARLVSQYTFHSCNSMKTNLMTFVDFLKMMESMNLKSCNDHYGFQWMPQDHNFKPVKIEEFQKFVDLFNRFGKHQFKVSDFRAGHVKIKMETDQKWHNRTFREVFDAFNADTPNLERRKKAKGDKYYVGIEPQFRIPSYAAFYPDEVRERAYRLMKNDIDSLGYDFEGMVEVNSPHMDKE